MKRSLKLFLLFLVLVSHACTRSDSKRSNDTILQAKPHDKELVIGMVDAFSGPRAEFGNSARNGVLLALDEWQSRGSLIQGRKLRISFFDDGADVARAKVGFESLMKEHNIVALIGPSSSLRSMALGPLVQEKRVPMITPSSTHPDVTSGKDYVFRACFVDTLQGQMMAQFVRKKLSIKRIGLLVDEDLVYSQHLAKVFAETFIKLGGEIVGQEVYRGEKDMHFETQLRSLQLKKPDALYIPGFYSNLYQIVSQARNLGLKQTLLGGDGWDSDKFFEQAKGFLEGSYFSTHFSIQSTDPTFVAFKQAFEKKYKRVPNAFAALAYDASLMLFEALSRASSLSSESIRDQLAATERFAGATGLISLDSSRNAVKPVTIMQIKSGNPRFETSYAP